MNNKFTLDGKTALITGGAGLLGVQHAKAILDIGGSVILTDLNLEKLENEVAQLKLEYSNSDILAMAMDVTSEESIKQACKEIQSKSIHVSILINNAAIDPKVDKKSNINESSRLENFNIDQWNLELAVGLTGTFLTSKFFGSLMAKSTHDGVIINIASDLSVISPDQRLYSKTGLPASLQPVKPITYSAIKSGLIGITRYLSTYWADQGVRCNALSPGGVKTNQDDIFVKNLTSRIPMGRMATIDEYNGTIQFLCSDASKYLNGQNIIVDGGRSVW